MDSGYKSHKSFCNIPSSFLVVNRRGAYFTQPGISSRLLTDTVIQLPIFRITDFWTLIINMIYGNKSCLMVHPRSLSGESACEKQESQKTGCAIVTGQLPHIHTRFADDVLAHPWQKYHGRARVGPLAH